MSGHRGDAQGSGLSKDEVVEAVAAIRLHGERWEEYRQAMREHTSRFEEASVSLGAGNYFVEKGLAARRELDSYVGQLAYQQSELLTETMGEITSAAEDQSEQFGRKEAGA